MDDFVIPSEDHTTPVPIQETGQVAVVEALAQDVAHLRLHHQDLSGDNTSPTPSTPSQTRSRSRVGHTRNAHSLECIPKGTILDKIFEVEHLLRRESHADVYKVAKRCDEGPEPPTSCLSDHGAFSLEARAFSFQGIPPELAKYRRRSMRRLRGRSLAVTTLKGLEVIVYHTHEVPSLVSATKDQNSIKHSQADGDTGNEAQTRPDQSGSPLPETAMTNKGITPPKRRSAYQQESRKLRQRDRRQRCRRRTRSLHAGEKAGDLHDSKPFGTVVDEMSFGDDGMTMLVMLHLMHDSKSGDRVRLPRNSSLKSALESFVSMKDEQPELDREEHIREFLDIKERELAYLNRKLAQMPAVLEQYNSRIKGLIKQQIAHKPQSATWFSLEPKKRALVGEYNILRLAHSMLPVVIESAKEMIQSVRRRLSAVHHEVKASASVSVSAQLTDAERSRLRKEETRYEEWKKYVVPSSAAYVLLDSKLNTIRKELEHGEDV